MTATVRTTEPTTITTREEVHWTKSFADYPATLWQLNYYFRGPGTGEGTGFNAVWATEVTADGDDFSITVAGTKTDDITVAGVYLWQAWVTEIADSTNKKMILSGRTNVLLGFDPADLTVDVRTPAKIALDTIDAALLAFSSTNAQEYEITTPAGSRRVKRSATSELLSLRKYWAGIVALEQAKERMKNGGPFAQRIGIRVYDE